MTVRVLNTRPRDQAAELSRLLGEAGFEPVELPAIEIIPAWQAAEMRVIADRLRVDAYQWLILPSANAGRFLVDGLSAHRLTRPDLAALPVVCGAANGQTLGITPTLGLPTFSAAAALDAVRPTLRPGQRVLLPRALAGRDELLTGLEAAGIEVDAPVCYRTVPARIERVPDVDVVTLCSPSAAEAMPFVANALVVCLGATTANAVREKGLRVAAVAGSTSMASLVEAVGAALAQREVSV